CCEPMRASFLGERCPPKGERHPQINPLWEGEAFWHHARHRVTLSVKAQVLPDDPRRTAEPALPQTMTEDHYALVLRLFFITLKGAAHRGLYAEQRKQTRRNQCPAESFGRLPVGKVHL